jgi:thiol-disulfide isomerase/thioredoxin
MRAMSHRVLLLVFVGLGSALPARADEQAGARAFWDEVVKAYRALPAYRDHGIWSLKMAVEGKPIEQSMPMSVRFARPNRFAIEAGPVRVSSDGTRLTTAVEPLKRYAITAAPAKLSLEAFDNNALGAMLLSGPGGAPLRLVLNLLVTEAPGADILAGSSGLVSEPDQTRDGQTHRVLRVEYKDGPDLRLTINPDTKLVRRVEVLMKPSEGLPPQEGRPELAWSSGPITTQPPPDGAFAFEPPAGFAKVADLESRKKDPAEGKSPLEELVGKPAPDFTLTVLDGPGKTREVRKADLAGKVVLIDFWATWCPPCMAELPEVQNLVDDYAKRNAKGVVVVALSIDSDPGAHDDVRTLVEKTLAGKELKLTEGPVSLVGLDPSQTIPKLFHVSGIPTVFLLDGQGIVQAVHVGFRPDVRESLSREIDSLLEGGSLLPKTGQPAVKPGEPK